MFEAATSSEEHYKLAVQKICDARKEMEEIVREHTELSVFRQEIVKIL